MSTPDRSPGHGLLHRLAARDVDHLWPLIASPTVWAVHFLVCYVGVAVGCAKFDTAAAMRDLRIGLAALTVVALGIVLLFGRIAWLQSREDGAAAPFDRGFDRGTARDRERFIATAKLLLAALSFVAILFVAMPVMFFSDCR